MNGAADRRSAVQAEITEPIRGADPHAEARAAVATGLARIDAELVELRRQRDDLADRIRVAAAQRETLAAAARAFQRRSKLEAAAVRPRRREVSL